MVDESGNTSGEEITLEPSHTVTKTRPRALWAVLAVVAVAAGALAVTSGGDGGPPRLPIAFGSTGGAREAAGASMSADMALAWVTYVAGEGLPPLGGEAPAYRLTGDVNEARVRSLATALGMTGDPVHNGTNWHLESGQAVVEVYEDGGGSWWYSAFQGDRLKVGSGGGSTGCEPDATECAVAQAGTEGPVTTVPADCNPDGTCSSDSSGGSCAADGSECTTTTVMGDEPCPDGPSCTVEGECPPNADCIVPPPTVPTPPADLPSKDEARRIALDLLEATGMDVADTKVTVDGPYDAWYVTVEPRIDGLTVSGWMASVGVGSKGVILSASGMLGTPDRLGSYPLIDTHAAIDRLNALQGGIGGGPVPVGAPGGVSRDVGVAPAEAPASTPPCAPDGATCATLIAPVDPPTTIPPTCKVQPDGSEICESTGVGSAIGCVVPTGAPEPTSPCPADGGTVECLGPPVSAVDPAVEPSNVAAGDCGPIVICDTGTPPVGGDGVTETTPASPVCTDPGPPPEPIEVVLTEATRVLVMMPAFDGSNEAYLVPGYRFSNADGVMVEVAAVDDDSLAPTTTVPDTTETSGAPVPPPTSCETLVEGDSSGTTHTVQTCPQPADPARLEPGQKPEVGVAYYVDVNVMTGHCSWISVDVADRWWWAELSNEALADWSTPTEGGSFTLVDPDTAEFVGDANRTKVAKLTQFGDGTQPPLCS